MGGGGSGGVDFKKLPRPEIKFRQYLTPRGKCAYILSALVFSSPVMTKRRL